MVDNGFGAAQHGLEIAQEAVEATVRARKRRTYNPSLFSISESLCLSWKNAGGPAEIDAELRVTRWQRDRILERCRHIPPRRRFPGFLYLDEGIFQVRTAPSNPADRTKGAFGTKARLVSILCEPLPDAISRPVTVS